MASKLLNAIWSLFFLVRVVNVLYSATVFELKRTNVKTEIKSSWIGLVEGQTTEEKLR